MTGDAGPRTPVITRRPLVGLTVCYVAGTWAGLTRSPDPGAVLAAAAGLWALSAALHLLVRRTRRAEPVALPALCAGVFFTALFAALTSPGRTPGLCLPPAGERVEAVGVVAADPDVRPTGDRFVWRFPLRVESLRGDMLPGRPVVPVRMFGLSGGRGPQYGERWRVAGVVEPCFAGRGRSERRSRGLCLRAWARGADRLSSGHGWGPAELCYRLRRRAAECLALGVGDRPDEVGVVRALLLGYRGELSPAAQRLAVASGTLHIFAISGMHVVVVAGIVVFALRALRIPRVHWVFPIAPVLAAYTFATGMAASAVRACVMALAYWAAPALGRRADTASALALATLGIVAAAPAQLFDVGFIYSFAAVLGLILFYRPFYAPIGRMLARDPAAEPLPRSRAAEWARAAAAHVGGVWAASCAASLTSIPLTACFFGRFSFVALPCNLFVVPLSFLMVLAACLSLALAPCAAWLAEVFNSANLAMTAALLRFLDVVTALPGACCDVPPPAPWALAVWYAALGGIAVLLQWRAARR